VAAAAGIKRFSQKASLGRTRAGEGAGGGAGFTPRAPSGFPAAAAGPFRARSTSCSQVPATRDAVLALAAGRLGAGQIRSLARLEAAARVAG
jgi:hypothetical protein